MQKAWSLFKSSCTPLLIYSSKGKSANAASATWSESLLWPPTFSRGAKQAVLQPSSDLCKEHVSLKSCFPTTEWIVSQSWYRNKQLEWLQRMPASFLQHCGAALQWCAPSHWEWFLDDPEICISHQPPRHIFSVGTSSPHTHCSRQSHSQELWIINHNNSFSIASRGRSRISTSLAYCISVTHSPLAWFTDDGGIGVLKSGTFECRGALCWACRALTSTTPPSWGLTVIFLQQSTYDGRYFVKKLLSVSQQQGHPFCRAAPVAFKY